MTAPTGRAVLADAITDQTTLDLLLQTGSVLAVNGDGTLSVDLAGATLTLPRLNSYNAVVGDAVTVVNAGGKRLVLGRAGAYVGGGLVARAYRTTDAPAPPAGVTRLSAAVVAGRSYRISATGISMHSGDAGTMTAYLTYSTDGVDPTTASTKLVEGFVTCPAAGVPATLSLETIYTPASGHTLKLLLGYALAAGGSGAGMLLMTGRPLEVTVTDVGPAVAAGGAQL